MDLTKITNINDLKALAYDQIAAKEQAERNLAAINQRIQEVLNAPAEKPTKNVKEVDKA